MGRTTKVTIYYGPLAWGSDPVASIEALKRDANAVFDAAAGTCAHFQSLVPSTQSLWMDTRFSARK